MNKYEVVIFLLSVLKTVVTQEGCPINEILTTVVNPCNSCSIRRWCPEEAGLTCDCAAGYYRDDAGKCVLPDQCEDYPINYDETQPRCQKPNEIYSDCGPACPPTCENYGGAPCAESCVPGCFCTPGYVRYRGVCIRPEQCRTELDTRLKRCGPNEEFRSCGTACPATCGNRNPGPCTLQCVQGCFCKRGYLKRGKECVREDECPVRRPPIRPAITGRNSGYNPPPFASPYRDWPPAYYPVRRPSYYQPYRPYYQRPSRLSRPSPTPVDAATTTPATTIPPTTTPATTQPPTTTPATTQPPTTTAATTELPTTVPPTTLPPTTQPPTTTELPTTLPPTTQPPTTTPPTTLQPTTLQSSTAQADSFTMSYGCPSQMLCRNLCRYSGFVTGFCVGEGWRTCRCY